MPQISLVRLYFPDDDLSQQVDRDGIRKRALIALFGKSHLLGGSVRNVDLVGVEKEKEGSGGVGTEELQGDRNRPGKGANLLSIDLEALIEAEFHLQLGTAMDGHSAVPGALQHLGDRQRFGRHTMAVGGRAVVIRE